MYGSWFYLLSETQEMLMPRFDSKNGCHIPQFRYCLSPDPRFFMTNTKSYIKRQSLITNSVTNVPAILAPKLSKKCRGIN